VSSYCIEKKADNVNQIIDELVELNKAVKTPAAKIGSVVSQIRAAGHDSAKAFGAFYAKVKSNCKAGNGYLKSFTAKLNGDMVSAKSGVNSANGRIKRSTTAAARLAKRLGSSKSALKRSHARQAKEARVFRQNLLEAEGKVVVIRHVRNIVVDELLNGKAPASLIQVNTITSKLQELKTMVEKDNDSMFSAVVGTLLEMVSEKNLNNQKILRKFLGALRKLKNRIVAWRKKALGNSRRIRRLSLASNAARLKSIRALGRLLVEARSSVVAAKRTIDELKNASGLISRALSRKATEVKNWGRLCADQKRVAGLFGGAYNQLRNKVKQVAASLLNLQ